MPTINQLSATDAVSGSDKLALFQGSQQDTRAVSVDQLTEYVRSDLEGTPDETIYNLTTVGSGFTVTVLPTTEGGSVWAQLTLSGPATTGTVILPGVDDRVPGQEIRVTCTQSVATLAVNGNGATVSGAPTSLSANGFFTLAFDSISSTWYRVA